MEKLFNPKSIAVIGASRHPQKLGYQILENLIKAKFPGQIYPVNPEAKSILTIKCYPDILSVEKNIDLAIIIVPAKFVPIVLRQCAQKNVGFAVVVSAGFSEVGGEGKILQEEIKTIHEAHPTMRILGPNCLGVFNTNKNLNATFAAPYLRAGGVSAVFQSGALGVALLDWAEKYEFGFAKFLSLGNKVDLEESEIINYLKDDPETKIIALYLERISYPANFLNICREAAKKKPIVILKGGTTVMGAKAAFSHTASMISSTVLNKAIFTQANLISAQSIEEMLNLIQILSTETPVNKNSLAIITNAGGPAILATDQAEEIGIKMPALSPQTANHLKKTLPDISIISNPIDLTGEAKAEHYKLALESTTKDELFGSLLVILTPQTATEVEETAMVLSEFKNSEKVIAAAFLGDQAVNLGKKILIKNKIPHFEDPELAVATLSKIAKYWQRRYQPDRLLPTRHDFKTSAFNDPFALLKSFGIKISPYKMVDNNQSAIQAAADIGYPVAIKLISPRFIHKSRSGKVKLNIQNEYQVKMVLGKLGFPALIQKMVDAPFEIIIGAKRDQNFGTFITFGWGGIFVEDLKDTSTRLSSGLTETDLNEMIKETKIGRVLIREKIKLDPIKTILTQVFQIMDAIPEIEEMDLNPIKVSSDNAICVDVRIKLEER